MKVVARAIITNEQGQVLLGRRTRGMGEGQYALIGGKPDQGETPTEAVIREVKEELGLDFEPTLIIDSVDAETDSANPWKTYFFTGTSSGIIHLKEDEISDIVFISEGDLDNLDIAFDHKERLRDFFRQRSVDSKS